MIYKIRFADKEEIFIESKNNNFEDFIENENVSFFKIDKVDFIHDEEFNYTGKYNTKEITINKNNINYFETHKNG